jgi:uncharacterized protein (TIGR00296 family)
MGYVHHAREGFRHVVPRFTGRVFSSLHCIIHPKAPPLRAMVASFGAPQTATKDMCAAAFAAIEDRLGLSSTRHSIDAQPGAAPVFVTLKTKDGGLRGCIGTFSSEPLETQLPKYGVHAAFKDGRFSPVRASELDGLQCTVSVLHSFERLARFDEWEVGRHGIRIRGVFRGDPFSSTFLPKVASEQGWSCKTTVEQLLRKADVRNSPEVWDTLEFERYQHSESSLSYKEYLNSFHKPDSPARTTAVKSSTFPCSSC